MTKRRLPTSFVFDEATSDAGMTKMDRVRFHAFNPNGAVAKLPKDEEFVVNGTLFYGAEMLYSVLCNYHAKALRGMTTMKPGGFSHWDIDYHVRRLESDAEEARALLAEKRAAALSAA